MTIDAMSANKLAYDEITADAADTSFAADKIFRADDLSYVWSEDGTDATKVSTLYNIIANTYLEDMLAGDGGVGRIALFDDLKWLAIADLDLGIDNNIIGLIDDVPLCKMDTAMNDIYVGELIGYTKGSLKEDSTTDYVWYTDETKSTEVTGIEGVMVNVTLGNLGDIETRMEDIYIGELMDYTKGDLKTDGSGDYVWYTTEAKTTEVTGFDAIVSNIKIGGLDTVDFSTKVKSLKLKDVLTIESGSLLDTLITDETTCSTAASDIENKLKNLTIEEMLEHGIITIDGYDPDAASGEEITGGTAKKIDNVFKYNVSIGGYSYPDGETSWTQLTIDEFINGILSFIPDVPAP